MVPDSALNEFIARIAINCISNTQYDSSKFTSVVQTFETSPYISLLRWNLRVHELNKLIDVFMLHGHLEIGALSAIKKRSNIPSHGCGNSLSFENATNCSVPETTAVGVTMKRVWRPSRNPVMVDVAYIIISIIQKQTQQSQGISIMYYRQFRYFQRCFDQLESLPFGDLLHSYQALGHRRCLIGSFCQENLPQLSFIMYHH